MKRVFGIGALIGLLVVFLCIATLRLLVPARAWSARRERRWGDLMGVETNISKVSIGT